MSGGGGGRPPPPTPPPLRDGGEPDSLSLPTRTANDRIDADAGLEVTPGRGSPPSRSGGGVGGGGSSPFPRVVAVTVNYNGAAFLDQFLESFRDLTYPNLGLVVVDNASRDGSWRLVSDLMPGARLIRLSRNTGFTGGNNRAVRQALAEGTDYVLFLNDDTRLDPGLVDALVSEAGPSTMVAPHVYLEGSDRLLDDTIGDFSWTRGAWRRWVLGKPAPHALRRPGPVPMATLTALLVPAAVFHEVGFLDERMFMYYEDFDFVRRAQQAGYRLRQTPAARLWHRRAASSGGGETAFKYYYATRNRLYLLRRHQPLVLFVPICCYLVGTRLLRAVQVQRSGRPDLARAIVAGTLDFFRGRMGKTWRPPGEA
jgi:GT2 family glycosyltransferase